MPTAFFTNPLFHEHQTGAGHPERPERMDAITSHLRAAGLWEQLVHPPFSPAHEDKLLLCHDYALVHRIESLAAHGGGAIDPDTRVSPVSYDVVCHAVGAALRAVEGVLSGEWNNAFVAARPPGHHATPSRAMGFCLFNTVAIAARYAQRELGMERVAVLDFDVHHGNGTQDIFYYDPSVFFASVHQTPFYPYTGGAEERGGGAAVGTTLNIPLPPGHGNEQYFQAWQRVGEAVHEFSPNLIMVSAGYDAHFDDPLGGMKVTEAGFAALMKSTLEWAQTLCGGRVVAVLEGGYSLAGLGASVAATLKVMCQESEGA
jgi:acetoin utilization deacetylase AcuC-like enzyme